MPPIPPVTIVDRVTAIGGAAMMTCIVFAVGFVIHQAISKTSESKRIQGRPIVWWMSILYFSGACFGACLADNQRYYLYEVVGGMGGFGLLLGFAIGNIHGFLDLYRARRIQPDVTAVLSDSIPNSQVLNDENPYAPPRQS